MLALRGGVIALRKPRGRPWAAAAGVRHTTARMAPCTCARCAVAVDSIIDVRRVRVHPHAGGAYRVVGKLHLRQRFGEGDDHVRVVARVEE